MDPKRQPATSGRNAPRAMRGGVRRLHAVLAVLVLAALLSLAAGCGDDAKQTAAPRPTDTTASPTSQATSGPLPSPLPDEKVTAGEGYRFDRDGWIYLHLEGDAWERGYQHGRLVARELEEVMRVLEGITLQENGTTWEQLRNATPRLFRGRIPDELETEMRGIAAGARSAGVEITYQDVLGWNAYEEVTSYWWPGVVSGEYPDLVREDAEHCSAFVATGSYTADGGVVMAHNSWDAYYQGRFFNVVCDLVPDEGHRILMQSAPGYIASFTDFFVTDAGLMGTETTIGGFDEFDPSGTPEFVRARRAMQYASGPDAFIRIMKKGNDGGYANSWLLADCRTGEILRFEQGLKYQPVTRTSDGYLVGCNAPFDPRIRNLECDNSGWFYDVRTAMGARRVRFDQLMAEFKGRIDVEAGQMILADHYDVYLQEGDNPCSRTIEGRYDLDDMRYWPGRLPFRPQGAVDGKVMDAKMATEMSFTARFGSSSGIEFDADEFLEAHPQWGYLKGYLVDLPTQPWSEFTTGDE